MGFRTSFGPQVWGFAPVLAPKYGVSHQFYPDFTLKSENAELTVIERTIIESLSHPLQQRFLKTIQSMHFNKKFGSIEVYEPRNIK